MAIDRENQELTRNFQHRETGGNFFENHKFFRLIFTFTKVNVSFKKECSVRTMMIDGFMISYRKSKIGILDPGSQKRAIS